MQDLTSNDIQVKANIKVLTMSHLYNTLHARKVTRSVLYMFWSMYLTAIQCLKSVRSELTVTHGKHSVDVLVHVHYSYSVFEVNQIRTYSKS